jgi:hypothetical protein
MSIDWNTAGEIGNLVGAATSVFAYCWATWVAIKTATRHPEAFRNIAKEKPKSAVLDAIVRDDSSAIDSAPASFSRVTGIIGATFVTAFLWCLGLNIIVKVWFDADGVGKVLAGSGDFVLTGSALFMPYAFNQLSQVFNRTPAAPQTSSPTAASPGAPLLPPPSARED